MKNIIIIFGLTTLFCGCSTPYQSSGWMGGYTEQPLGDDRYLVSFRGNGYTGSEVVREYAIRRALELCSEKNMKAELQNFDNDTESKIDCSSSYGNFSCQQQNRHIASVMVRCSLGKH